MISGNKIIIEAITKNWSRKILDWVNIEELRSLTGTVYPVSEYEHEKWIENQTTMIDWKLFMVCDKESHEPIGTIGLKNFDWISRNVELFISLPELSRKWKKAGGGVWNRCCIHPCQILFS